MTISVYHYLVTSGALFTVGLCGLLLRRNILVMYMCLELMLNAANLTLVAFSRFNGKMNGQILAFFVITVAAAEVAVGLALIVALFRAKQSTRVEAVNSMKF